jgi:hypothetical protein
MKGRIVSPDWAAKISAGLTGKVQSEEHRAHNKSSHRRHGHSGGERGKPSPTYESWRSMCSRCNRVTDPAYPKYGGSGITVCDRWNFKAGGSFENFLADMRERPDWATGGIDRIDGTRGYEPGNCRWASSLTQARNRRPRKVHT